MTVIDQQGHWHQLGTVDVRLDEGLVVAYDTHHYIIATVKIEDLEAGDALTNPAPTTQPEPSASPDGLWHCRPEPRPRSAARPCPM